MDESRVERFQQAAQAAQLRALIDECGLEASRARAAQAAAEQDAQASRAAQEEAASRLAQEAQRAAASEFQLSTAKLQAKFAEVCAGLFHPARHLTQSRRAHLWPLAVQEALREMTARSKEGRPELQAQLDQQQQEFAAARAAQAAAEAAALEAHIAQEAARVTPASAHAGGRQCCCSIACLHTSTCAWSSALTPLAAQAAHEQELAGLAAQLSQLQEELCKVRAVGESAEHARDMARVGQQAARGELDALAAAADELRTETRTAGIREAQVSIDRAGCLGRQPAQAGRQALAALQAVQAMSAWQLAAGEAQAAGLAARRQKDTIMDEADALRADLQAAHRQAGAAQARQTPGCCHPGR